MIESKTGTGNGGRAEGTFLRLVWKRGTSRARGRANPCVLEICTRAVSTSIVFSVRLPRSSARTKVSLPLSFPNEGLSLGFVARESLESHAGGAWPERGQLTHVHAVRASYYMLHMLHGRTVLQQRRNRCKRAQPRYIRWLHNEYRTFLYRPHLREPPATKVYVRSPPWRGA